MRFVSHLLVFIAVALASSTANSQPVSQPQPEIRLPSTLTGLPNSFIVIKPDAYTGDDISWQILDTGLSMLPPELLSSRSTLVVTGSTGTYRVQAICTAVVDGKAKLSPISTCTITIGQPTPTPDPTPNPQTDDPIAVTTGPKNILIVYESSATKPAFANQITLLRSGDWAKYLSTNNHTLYVYDKDTVDETGSMAKELKTWQPHWSGMNLPALFIVDKKTNLLVSKYELDPTPTLTEKTNSQVIDLLKKNGG